jgi:hypothetical protein
VNVRILREYMRMCLFLDVKPSWEGLRSFKFSYDIKNISEINRIVTKAGGKQNGGY